MCRCDHNWVSDNAHCINEECDWCGPYLLEGPGSWEGTPELMGDTHCPQCGHGKYIYNSLIPELTVNKLLLAAQKALERG